MTRTEITRLEEQLEDTRIDAAYEPALWEIVHDLEDDLAEARGQAA